MVVYYIQAYLVTMIQEHNTACLKYLLLHNVVFQIQDCTISVIFSTYTMSHLPIIFFANKSMHFKYFDRITRSKRG